MTYVQKCRINYLSKSVLCLRLLRPFKEIKIPPLQLSLQLVGDAVGGFVVLFDPFSTLRVLDGHSSHTCGEERDIYTRSLQTTEASSPSLV